MGLSVITVSGFLSDNPLRKLGDLNLWADSYEYNVVEMTHHIWLVAVIDYLIEIKALNNIQFAVIGIYAVDPLAVKNHSLKCF